MLRLTHLCCIALSLAATRVEAATFSTIYSFPVSESDGAFPFGQLALGSDGNFYGTTNEGGAAREGTLFKVTPQGQLTTLYSFTGGSDGSRPYAGVVIDKAGNLYGTTFSGGTFNLGTVFKLSPDGTETVLHSFGAKGDGANPYTALTIDSKGKLYGVTYRGGHGGGTIFVVTPAGAETVLHKFVREDGTFPQGRLFIAANRDIYGTTVHGGDGLGTVFKLTRHNRFSVLYNIGSKNDGKYPLGGLVMDRAGFLYGTSYTGQTNALHGSVYRIRPDGAENLVYAFKHTDGANPSCDLVVDAKGALYGTTQAGGHNNGSQGVVFKLLPNGAEMVLHSFTGPDGARPFAGLTFDSSGNLYGVTEGDSRSNTGTIFKITP